MKSITKRMLILIFTSLLWSGPSFAQDLKVATIAPENSKWMTEMKAASNEISDRTGGRVSFRFYGGGVMGNDNQVRRKMRIGQLHGATFTSGSLGEFTRDAEIYSLPLVFRSNFGLEHGQTMKPNPAEVQQHCRPEQRILS